MTICLITTSEEVVNGEDVDLIPLTAALKGIRIRADARIWHDSTIDWAAYELLVMRSPWDYPERLAEFLTWLDVASSSTEILNCPHTIRWNLDKAYLLELQALDVPIVATSIVSSEGDLEEALRRTRNPKVVVKPAVSVGSRDTGLFEYTDPAAYALGRAILASGRRVLVQPAIESVREVGETELIYFDGKFSHALCKGPILADGGGFIDGRYSEVISSAVASPATVEVANRAIAGIVKSVRNSGCDCRNPVPLYARFDIVDDNGAPRLLEAEMFEPSYFVDSAPGSALRFAMAVAGRLGRARA